MLVYLHVNYTYSIIILTRLENPGVILDIRQLYYCTIFVFFGFRLLSVLRSHSVFHPCHCGQWLPTSKDFLSKILSITLYIFSYLNSQERASISLFNQINVECQTRQLLLIDNALKTQTLFTSYSCVKVLYQLIARMT